MFTKDFVDSTDAKLPIFSPWLRRLAHWLVHGSPSAWQPLGSPQSSLHSGVFAGETPWWGLGHLSSKEIALRCNSVEIPDSSPHGSVHSLYYVITFSKLRWRLSDALIKSILIIFGTSIVDLLIAKHPPAKEVILSSTSMYCHCQKFSNTWTGLKYMNKYWNTWTSIEI